MLDIEEIQEELTRFHRNVEFGQTHYDDLLARYSERWVAIYDEAVVGTGSEKVRLIDELRQRGIPPEHTYFAFLTHDDTIPVV